MFSLLETIVSRRVFRLTVLASALAISPLLSFAQHDEGVLNGAVSGAASEETTVETITTQAASPVAGEIAVSPTMLLKVPAATLRTPKQVTADAPRAALAPQGEMAPFRPTIGDAHYLAAKEAALRAPQSARPQTQAPVPLAPPVFVGPSFEGVNQGVAGGGFPPDTHGAVGRNHFVEVTNSHLDVYTKAGVLVKSNSLAIFLGYFTKGLFDPRVIYDRTYDRYIVTAEAFPESTSIQRYFIAISRTGDPLGSYFIYNLNATAIAGVNNFFDFPQVGMDQDSIIATGNVFSPTAFLGWRMVAIAKARLYNGAGFSVPIFAGSPSDGTIAPPIGLDQNAKTFLVAAPPISSSLRLYTLRDSSRTPGVSLTGPVAVSVAAYSLPPNATQCGGIGTAQQLDSGDARFVNASTQSGNFLWASHSIDFFGAAVRWYKINTATNSVAAGDTHTHFASGSSSDFNASIAANDAGDVYVNWNSSSSTVCPQVRFSGQRATDVGTPSVAGIALFTSPTKLTGNFDPRFGTQRWGDYSAVTVDPLNSLRGWLVNEKVNSANVWGSRIGRVGF